MNFNKYAKLLLILGLFAAVPAQGMSYVNYVKSFFVKKAEVQNDDETFRRALKDGDFSIAQLFFSFSTPSSWSRYIFILTEESPELIIKFLNNTRYKHEILEYPLFNYHLKINAVKFFSAALKLCHTELAIEFFTLASENDRRDCIQIVALSPNLLKQAIAMRLCCIYPELEKLFADAGLTLNSSEPTTKNLKRFGKHAGDIIHKFSSDPSLLHIWPTVVAKEVEFANDYHTFVHGQRKEYYFCEKLYTFLWQIKKKRSLNNFLFAHVKDLASPDDALQEKLNRNFLLAQGSDQDESKILFMNYALFANSIKRDNCSASLVMRNHNWGDKTVSLLDAFKPFGYETIYEKFKTEIEALGQEYNAKSNYGNLLFIAVPKEKIKKYVYLTRAGGAKVSAQIFTEGGGMSETADIKVILENLLNPSKDIHMSYADMFEFALIMTQKKGGLGPDTGIKIIPILSGDPAKLAELQKKEDALFAKIKAAIEEENAKAQATAVTRANTIVNHLVLPSKDAADVAPAKTMARINNIMGHIQPQEQMN